jgi:hypothetical protein
MKKLYYLFLILNSCNDGLDKDPPEEDIEIPLDDKE